LLPIPCGTVSGFEFYGPTVITYSPSGAKPNYSKDYCVFSDNNNHGIIKKLTIKTQYATGNNSKNIIAP
jgi:hypothetical protein